ncbi:conserved hypothetical protein [Bosea sp. 62]|uniref:hypothetical protein n=1 Tax=unclassified Bosea (in: a-proteobacteria) TaxID=2653178 RepID=UPI0012585DCB|nr:MULTISPECIES: hypothetical protein [unclassified Bosea (in: a-proteobacteria)]CAD5251263.1 conserved hypothetical protein [Bosea sp. 21B]CAD5262259.1 conserved hypothetical protein [Bosea sp. 7B]CAD5272384.1 conserved hypothetical protein [Bosea sp. 46]VVT43651.1 conserved hypothetical protein [Bosea sp. EC-HK365B]VXB22298.1 conserved hypothetical protein [Bosea sp. 29B]
MDNDKRLPPDVPSNEDEIDRATGSVAARAADLANRTAETVKDGYGRAKEKLAEIDPRDTLRDAGRYAQETGEAAVETVNRHPLATFAVGALSVGLLTWAMTPRRSSWQPDTSGWTRMLRDYSDQALRAGRDLVGNGREQLDRGRDYANRGQDYLDMGRDYAREGGQMLVRRGEREPLAAVVGVGLALYVIGSLLSSSGSSSQSQPAARRRAKR